MPGEIIESAFQEWTAGRPFKEQVISIFLHIRDIPYSLISSPPSHTSGPEHLLVVGRGSCGPKHHLLGSMFNRLGIQVRYRTWPFLWDDPSLSYPPDLRAAASMMGINSHLACLALLYNTWVLVDATWDPPLKKAGFPVNCSWDGRSDTLLAVRPVNRDENHELQGNLKSGSLNIGQRDAAREEFVRLFNAWLDQVRDGT